jgi:methylated-DNA-[protein]-cysteine S-methyltransferase
MKAHFSVVLKFVLLLSVIIMIQKQGYFQTYFDSPLGRLEIIASKHAINSVNFSEKKESDTTLKSNKITEACCKQLEGYFSGKRKFFTLNTEPAGTDFQKLVWKELEKIPYGKTVSYFDIAKVLGDLKSTRAVGNANSKNKIAIIVPCHRVIGANGSLTGYAGGLWRKQWLLEHELKIAHGIQKLF